MHEYKPSMILVVMMVVSVMVVIEEKKSSIWGNFRGHQIKPDAPCEMWKSHCVYLYKTFLIFVNQCVFRCLDGYAMSKMGIQNENMKQI